MNWRRPPQVREQRAVSPFELIVGLTSYARRLQIAAQTLIDYFTPADDKEIRRGHRKRQRQAWRARRQATDAERKRRHIRKIARLARRVRAQRHRKSGRAA